MIKNIALLGSTGSIGQNTLNIVRKYPKLFKIIALSANKNIKLLKSQIQEFKPKLVAITNKKSYNVLKRENTSTKYLEGIEGIKKAIKNKEINLVVNALVGFAGLEPSLESIKEGKTLALANKESIVVAGKLLMEKASKNKVKIIPIDSEHNAILSLLKGKKKKEIRKLILTSSGGPFRNYNKEDLKNVKLKEALNHPTWKMGQKISIDSATLLNKGFEVIEAHHLFNFAYKDIKVVIHKESLIHSLIETIEGHFYAQIAAKDMKIPIFNALNYPETKESHYESLKIEEIQNLSFEKVNYNKFPLLKLAYKIGKQGGISPCILNAANEIAVEAFLEKHIKYLDIEIIINKVLKSYKHSNEKITLENLKLINSKVKEKTKKIINKIREEK